MQPGLRIEGVSRRYGDVEAVAGASLALDPGRITCLLGPSGCGKSTLLRLIAGLDRVDAGTIALDGETLSAPGHTVAPEARGIGLVFQDYALFPHLDVAANIGFGLKRAADRAERVRALIHRFRLDHRASAFPHTLSGGEQQRVAMARAMARRPGVVLMDEPFSGLDRHLRGDLRDAILAALREAGAAVLIVTHDAEEAMLMGDSVALMLDGRIVRHGTPEQCYRDPGSLAAARLLGDVNALPVTVRSEAADTPFGTLAAPGIGDGPGQLLIRPCDLAPSPGGAAARLIATRFNGPFHVSEVEIAGQRLRWTHGGKSPGSRPMLRPTAHTIVAT